MLLPLLRPSSTRRSRKQVLMEVFRALIWSSLCIVPGSCRRCLIWALCLRKSRQVIFLSQSRCSCLLRALTSWDCSQSLRRGWPLMQLRVRDSREALVALKRSTCCCSEQGRLMVRGRCFSKEDSSTTVWGMTRAVLAPICACTLIQALTLASLRYCSKTEFYSPLCFLTMLKHSCQVVSSQGVLWGGFFFRSCLCRYGGCSSRAFREDCRSREKERCSLGWLSLGRSVIGGLVSPLRVEYLDWFLASGLGECANQSFINIIRMDAIKIVESEEEDDFDQKQGRRMRKKGLLRDELAKMMIGFGETAEPREDSLELLELYVTEFITNLAKRALAKSQRAGFNSIQIRDLLKMVEEDEKMFFRVPQMLESLQQMKPESKP